LRALPAHAHRRLEEPALSADRAAIVDVELVAPMPVAHVLVHGRLHEPPIAVAQQLEADLERVIAIRRLDLLLLRARELAREQRQVLRVGLAEEHAVAVEAADDVQRVALAVPQRSADVTVVEEPALAEPGDVDVDENGD